jgi:hypothetical protein
LCPKRPAPGQDVSSFSLCDKAIPTRIPLGQDLRWTSELVGVSVANCMGKSLEQPQPRHELLPWKDCIICEATFPEPTPKANQSTIGRYQFPRKTSTGEIPGIPRKLDASVRGQWCLFKEVGRWRLLEDKNLYLRSNKR